MRKFTAAVVMAVLLAVSLHAYEGNGCTEGKSEISHNCITCDRGYAEMMDAADNAYNAGGSYAGWLIDAAAAVAWLAWCEATIYTREAF